MTIIYIAAGAFLLWFIAQFMIIMPPLFPFTRGVIISLGLINFYILAIFWATVLYYQVRLAPSNLLSFLITVIVVLIARRISKIGKIYADELNNHPPER